MCHVTDVTHCLSLSRCVCIRCRLQVRCAKLIFGISAMRSANRRAVWHIERKKKAAHKWCGRRMLCMLSAIIFNGNASSRAKRHVSHMVYIDQAFLLRVSLPLR